MFLVSITNQFMIQNTIDYRLINCDKIFIFKHNIRSTSLYFPFALFYFFFLITKINTFNNIEGRYYRE